MVNGRGTNLVINDADFALTAGVPEPPTMLLPGMGALGIMAFIHRRRMKQPEDRPSEAKRALHTGGAALFLKGVSCLSPYAAIRYETSPPIGCFVVQKPVDIGR